jgi:hypothetical protein
MISHVRFVSLNTESCQKRGIYVPKIESSGWDKGRVERYDEHHYLIMKSER